MKERLVQLLDLEQLSPSRFADIIGVQRSSVSHVISGRNNPSFDFLQKTLKAFPGLNADWLMLGEGTMYEKMGRTIPGTLFDQPAGPSAAVAADSFPAGKGIPADEKEDVFENQGGLDGDSQEIQRKAGENDNDDPLRTTGDPQRIVQVLVFYEDHTFRSYGPAQ